MSIRKLLTFIVFFAFIAILWYGVSKGEFAESVFNGNLL